MIRVTVEMVPHGVEEKKYLLGTATIANDGSGSKTRGSYGGIFTHKGREWARAHVSGFHRSRRNVWHLLYECLRDAVRAR